MKLAFCILAVLIAFHAHAQTVNPPSGPVTFFDAKCTDPKVLAHVDPSEHHLLKAGEGMWEGKKYALCWATVGGMRVLIWEDGGFARVPEHIIQQHAEGAAI